MKQQQEDARQGTKRQHEVQGCENTAQRQAGLYCVGLPQSCQRLSETIENIIGRHKRTTVRRTVY
jgi:hypothetical protein